MPIISTTFNLYSENERKVLFEYTDNYSTAKYISKIIDKLGQVYFDGLQPNTNYSINKVYYNFKGGNIKDISSYKYVESWGFSFNTKVGAISVDNDSFKIKDLSVTNSSFIFYVYIQDKKNVYTNGNIYLFFKNLKGGISPQLSRIVNISSKIGSGNYTFIVENLSGGTNYEFLGISIDSVLGIDEPGKDEYFKNPIYVETLTSYQTNLTWIYISIILIIFILALVLIIIFLQTSLKNRINRLISRGWEDTSMKYFN